MARPTANTLRNAPRSDANRPWMVNPELHPYGERLTEILNKQNAPWTMARQPTRAAGVEAAMAAPVTDGFHAADRPYIFNVRPDPIDFRDRPFEPTLIEVPTFKGPTMPTGGRWEEGKIAVRDQGSEGSCTGHALAAVIDMQNTRRLADGADVPALVSARMLYECARKFDEFTDDALPGSSLRGALKGFWNNGVCDEELAPYVSGDLGWTLSPIEAKDARKVGLGAYMRLKHVLNDYHVAISEAGAIYCSAVVHEKWTKENVCAEKGVISYNRPKAGVAAPKPIGMHAFALVGYTPAGFLVVNSWGADWGGYDVLDAPLPNGQPLDGKLKKQLKDMFHGGGPLPGIALWSYEDWQDNVVDAWVVRLTAPTKLPSNTVGGYYRGERLAAGTPTGARADVRVVREIDVRGHIIHVNNGKLVEGGPDFPTPLASLEQTRDLLAEATRDTDTAKARYRHILYYAHGGLNGLTDATTRAGILTPKMKDMGVYPLFYCWRTSVKDALTDIAGGLLASITMRTQGLSDLTDAAIERVFSGIGTQLWREMKSDAYRLFNEPVRLTKKTKQTLLSSTQDRMAESGAGWEITQLFLALSETKDGARVGPKHHFVGHSAGAIALGHFCRRLMATKKPAEIRDTIETLTLFAPACTFEFFHDNLMPMARILGKERFIIFNLNTGFERSRDPYLRGYGKSLLHLVHKAFEEPVPMAEPPKKSGFDLSKFIGETRPPQPYIVGILEHQEPAQQSVSDKERAVAKFLGEAKSFTMHFSGSRSGTPIEDGALKSHACYHGSFDNDPATMNTLLTTILGRSANDPVNEHNGGYTMPEIGHEDVF